ncbi:MAG: acetyltransferase [bacterium]|nr:acetyltransferase [bacterium]
MQSGVDSSRRTRARNEAQIDDSGNTPRIELRGVDPDQDAGLMHAWSLRAHVREYWVLGEGLDGVRKYLREKIDSAYLEPRLIYIDGAAAGYTELYEYNRDPVAKVFPGVEDSRGWHIFLGEERFIGAGYAIHVGRAILDELFARSTCNAVYCEPDVRNLRMHRFVQKLGHREVGRVHLHDKTALIMQCDRADYESVSNQASDAREVQS